MLNLRTLIAVAVWVASGLTLLADTTGRVPTAPTYVDDNAFLDDFVGKLEGLAKAGKCMASAEIGKKATSDRRFAITPTLPGAIPLVPEEVYSKAKPSIFAIGCVKTPAEKDGDFGDGWFGTAWVLRADGILVTNWHLFEDPADMHYGVVDHTGKIYPLVDILAIDRRSDIAIIKIDAKDLTPLAVAETPAPVGGWVGLLSHPGNQWFTFTQGTVGRYTRNFGGPEAVGEKWMTITADYAGGSSGGPVLNKFGAVVGMACLTSNIDHDDDKPDAPKAHRRRDDPKPAPVTVPSAVQMVVKLTVPVTMIRKVLTPAMVDADDDVATTAKEMKRRFEIESVRLAKKIEKSTDDEATKKLNDASDRLSDDYARGLYRLGVSKADQPQSAAVLAEVVIRGGPVTEKALAVLLEKHTQSQRIARVVDHLATDDTPEGLEFLTAVAEKNLDRVCRGTAICALGIRAKAQAMRDDNDAAVKMNVALAASRFQQVAEEYADVKPDAQDATLGERLKKHLAGLKNVPNLKVGKTLPDINGVDIDGKPLKLSDYRGKVVLVDFWALWCPPCVEMIPHNAQLLTKYAGQPFAIVGINADVPGKDLKKQLRKKTVTWPNFRDVQAEGEPTLSDQFNVESLPTLYLLDKKGVIRKVWNGALDAEEVDAEVAKVLSE